MNLRGVFSRALSRAKVQDECARWRRPDCEQIHDTPRDAQTCCLPDVSVCYQCPHCESVWNTPEAVAECVDRHPDASLAAYDIQGFACPVCAYACDSIQDAVDCCLVLTHNHAQRWQMARDLEMGKVPV